MSAGLYPGCGIDDAFGQTARQWSGTDVWFLIVAYGFQLYFNFCGYCHIVIGAARLFGIQLHENFNRPYLSTTPSVFWTRWHMSLSFWIRDFVFLPLATLRREVWWRNLSLVIAMFVFGLWHKGSVLFMMWGTYHGFLLVFHRQWQEFRKRLGFEWSGRAASAISWLLTFAAVCVGYIFFRAETIGQAFAMLKAIASPRTYGHLLLDHSFYVMTLAAFLGYFGVLGIGGLLDRLGESTASAKASPTGISRLLATFANERWVWISPLVIVLALYLSMVFQPGHGEAGPVMYALF
jgi:D-alanyl-lipoteichoic acid acyltransferase DltB (MBOAT superfamily)